MGTMSFQLPDGLAPEVVQELGRACVTGGPDNMPWPTEAKVDGDRLTLLRDVDESGCVVAPWEVNGAGRLMTGTGTLIERTPPYLFQVELARGKINQLRCQAADWQMGGLQVSQELQQKIRDVSILFGRAVTQSPAPDAAGKAQEALVAGYRASDDLVRMYVEQMFHARHQRQPRLDTTLGCRLGAVPLDGPQADAVAHACNSIALPLSWRAVEAQEDNYNWQPHDDLLEWAQQQGLAVSAGPLIDFAAGQLPDWVWFWERDLSTLAGYMCEYVERAVKRYRGKVRVWQLTSATNCASLPALGEDELLWLTVRLAEAARQVDPNLALVVGISQPWGEYMALEDRTHSPFIFADTLIRSGLNLAALDLELIMGVLPSGSYCRDTLETSRLLDLYTLLGVPLRVTLGYPSSNAPDPNANPALRVGAGQWRASYSPENQAAWAPQFAALALCKPSVKSVNWVHLSDANAHQFPHCGLLDAEGKPKPVVKMMQELREHHLR